MDSKTLKPTTGVVTFLDILGWKGVYDRQANAIDSLTRLVLGLKSRAAQAERGRTLGKAEIKSISDTIGIFTGCSENEITATIESQGTLCQWLIPESIQAEIPMRGATAFGQFEIKDSIFVGKAVDEAASWHEQTDWIGVHLTPSAEFVFRPNLGRSAWKPFSPPHKARLNWKPHCVDWTANWADRDAEIELVKSKFRRLGPIVPEIAAKFTNTLDFIIAMKPSEAPTFPSATGMLPAPPLR